MKITLCTYEHPAARHLIEEWRASKGSAIKSWARLPSGRESVELDGEVLLIVPTGEDGRLSPRPFKEAMAGATEGFDKLIHFGRVPPIEDGLWMRAQLSVKESR